MTTIDVNGMVFKETKRGWVFISWKVELFDEKLKDIVKTNNEAPKK
ncbi:MAG: hypothetical protein GY679_02020 [Mycoplasma sp.]|nr:hypothetical protein [Mycoplasma sp.]